MIFRKAEREREYVGWSWRMKREKEGTRMGAIGRVDVSEGDEARELAINVSPDMARVSKRSWRCKKERRGDQRSCLSRRGAIEGEIGSKL